MKKKPDRSLLAREALSRVHCCSGSSSIKRCHETERWEIALPVSQWCNYCLMIGLAEKRQAPNAEAPKPEGSQPVGAHERPMTNAECLKSSSSVMTEPGSIRERLLKEVERLQAEDAEHPPRYVDIDPTVKLLREAAASLSETEACLDAMREERDTERAIAVVWEQKYEQAAAALSPQIDHARNAEAPKVSGSQPVDAQNTDIDSGPGDADR